MTRTFTSRRSGARWPVLGLTIEPPRLPAVPRLRRSRHDRRAARALRPRRPSTTTRLARLVVEKQDGVRAARRAVTRGSGSGRARSCGALREAGARLAVVSGARRAEIDDVLDAAALRDDLRRRDRGRGRHARQARSRGLSAGAARGWRRRPGGRWTRSRSRTRPPGLRAARAAGVRCVGLATTCPAVGARRRGRDRRVARRRSIRRGSRGSRRRRGVARRGHADPVHARAGARAARGHARARRSALQLPSPGRVPRAARGDRARPASRCSESAIPPPITRRCMTATGTGANEACLLALAGLGPGLIAANGFFAARLVEQAARNGIAHRVLETPGRSAARSGGHRPRARGIARRCAGCTSSATRRAPGLKNPLTELGAVARRRGVALAADVVSSAFAYPIDVEACGPRSRGHVVVEGDRRRAGAGDRARARGVPRAAARGAAAPATTWTWSPNATSNGARASPGSPSRSRCTRRSRRRARTCARSAIEAHMARMQRQMRAHRRAPGRARRSRRRCPRRIRSGVAVNFRLPAGLRYPEFARRMQQEGYYLLYGPPGDDGQFQVSTIGDLDDDTCRDCWARCGAC